MNNTALAASLYIRRGWAVVPVPYREKGPRLKGWPSLRIAEADVPRYWNDAPSNIGIILGQPSKGLVDVDLDCPEAVAAADMILPPTDCVFGRPGAPRSHRLYTVKTQEPVKHRHFEDPAAPAGTRAVLVELHGDGRAVTVPLSVHPSGEPIEWHSAGDPAVVSLADLERFAAILAAAAVLARQWGEGTRHEAALALAGMLRRGGWAEEPATLFVEAVAIAAGDVETADRRRCVHSTYAAESGEPKTGLTRLRQLVGEVVADTAARWLFPDIARQADAGNTRTRVPQGFLSFLSASAEGSEVQWPTPEPLDEEPSTPFPLDTLPTWLREWVEAVAEANQVPIDMPAMLALGMCGFALSRRVRVSPREGWSEPMNVFVVVVLNPANRKSSCLSVTVKPLEVMEQQAVEEARPLIAEAASEKAILEARLRQAQSQAAKPGKDGNSHEAARTAAELAKRLAAMKIPELPRYLADDVTSERLAGLMCANGGRLAVVSSEGGIFDIMAGKYSATGMMSIDVYLKGHDGRDPLRVDRMTRTEYVERPALSVALTIQPEVLSGLMERSGFRGRGLLARFFYILPQSLVGHRKIAPPPVPETTQREYVRKVCSLFLDPSKDGEEHVLRFSAEADQVLRDFETRLEPRLGPEGDLAVISDWAGKLAGGVVRLAAILHAAALAGSAPPHAGEVSADECGAACRIGEYLVDHALKAFDQMGGDIVAVRARALLAWLRRDSVEDFTRRDAMRACGRMFPDVDSLSEPLELLQEKGWIRPAAPPEDEGGRGRPPGQRYLVSPHLHGTTSEGEKGTSDPSADADKNDKNTDSTHVPTDGEVILRIDPDQGVSLEGGDDEVVV